MQEKILKLLKEFQDGYDRRDINYADEFMEKMFIGGENISILGTSFAELCLGYDECKKLFTDDWKYWSFEHLDFDNVIIKDYGSVFFAYVPAYFSFTFKHNNNYENYIEDMRNQLSQSNRLKIDLTQINWIIAHFLHSREEKDRKYMFDLRVCFILEKIVDDYKIKQIQFSVPEDYSDIRIVLPEIKSLYNIEKEKFSSIKSIQNDEIRNILKSFNDDINSLDVDELINQYFNLDDFIVFNVDNEIAENKEQLKLLVSNIKKMWQEIKFNCDKAYIEENSECGIVLTNGLGINYIDESTYLDKTKNKIFNILNGKLSNKDKLFNVRREISTMMRDISISNDYECPIRVHVIIRKINDRWLISYLQLSYPFYYILENKNRFMKLV